ncbi:MAG: hypothetical protein E7057_09225 [Lentisphaerae bacterium]|nr:hypothetical protein [Lentisphaerota bacterium]
MEMLAKYIRMRTARSAATASHPCVEHATEGINQYREQSQTEKLLPKSGNVFCSSFIFVSDLQKQVRD